MNKMLFIVGIGELLAALSVELIGGRTMRRELNRSALIAYNNRERAASASGRQ